MKSRKSRDTWSNRQVWPQSPKWRRVKANRVLSREHPGHSEYPRQTTQVMTLHMDIMRWAILKSDDYILSSWRWRTSIKSAKTRPGVDCGSDHELLIASNEMKVTQSCRTLCDPMDYTVHGILQARILELVAFPISRGYSQPTDQTQVSCIAGGFFTS